VMSSAVMRGKTRRPMSNPEVAVMAGSVDRVKTDTIRSGRCGEMCR
jgi:hypothetical protein